MGILLSSNISVDEINAAASGSTGIMELIKSTDKSDKTPVTIPEYGTKPVQLIHPRYNSLNTFYPVTNNLQFIQSGNNLQIMVPARSILSQDVSESTSKLEKPSGFISIARVPDTSISWKQDVRPLLSNVLAIKSEGVNFNRKGKYFEYIKLRYDHDSSVKIPKKVSLIYPISKKLPFEYSKPYFYALRGDEQEYLETDIVNSKLIKGMNLIFLNWGAW